MAQTKTPSSSWSYSYSNDWGKKYPQCRHKTGRTAPINIDTSKVSPCSELCRLGINYQSSDRCYISLVNDNPTVTFDPVSIIRFKREFFFLRRMTIHQPSMHTVNGTRFDMEIMLYHHKNKTSFTDGGVIFSILLKKGVDYGYANEFLNEFINQIPTQETKVEKEVEVSKDWNPLMLLPENKSFFYYDGALPYPPCDMKWTLVVFEEIVSVSSNIIDTIKFLLGGVKNIRPLQQLPPTAVVFYNNTVDFDSYEIREGDTANEPELKQSLNLLNKQTLDRKAAMNKNLYYIKAVVILIVFVMMIFLAIKTAKFIVANDYLNQFMLGQLQKKQVRNQEQAMQEQMSQGGDPSMMMPQNMAMMQQQDPAMMMPQSKNVQPGANNMMMLQQQPQQPQQPQQDK